MDKFKPFPKVFKCFNETRNTERKYYMGQQQQNGNSDLQKGLCWFLS